MVLGGIIAINSDICIQLICFLSNSKRDNIPTWKQITQHATVHQKLWPLCEDED